MSQGITEEKIKIFFIWYNTQKWLVKSSVNKSG